MMFHPVKSMPQFNTVFLCVTVKWPAIFSPVIDIQWPVLSAGSVLLDTPSNCLTFLKPSLSGVVLALIYILLDMDPESHMPIKTSDIVSFAPVPPTQRALNELTWGLLYVFVRRIKGVTSFWG